MFVIYFITCLIIIAASAILSLLCALVVYLPLSRGIVERKYVIKAALLTALAEPVAIVLDSAVSYMMNDMRVIGVFAAILMPVFVGGTSFYTLRRFAQFSRKRAVGASVILVVLIHVVSYGIAFLLTCLL